nr:MAG TPA: hypothetical protein [Caudoviricetes sp.]DAY22390.1 MAG TPA: hypothetical protein [Caudoviricetes sp.]
MYHSENNQVMRSIDSNSILLGDNYKKRKV